MPAGITEFGKICEILNLILCKKGWIEAFKEKFPKEAELFDQVKVQKGTLIDYAIQLISDFDMTLPDL